MMHASYWISLNLNELFIYGHISGQWHCRKFQNEEDQSFLHDCLWYSWVFSLQFVIPAKKISTFTPLFDEALNDLLYKVQMDMNIRFYNVDSAPVSRRYRDFRFAFRPSINVLSGEIINWIKDLGASRMKMLGMDDFNVNWYVFDKTNAEIKT